jgi:DNA-binding transcriptional ArsR family regulator
MRDVTATFRAVGDPTRARIVKLLEPGELCVCQIQAAVGLAPSTVSKHLSILRQAGLVDDRQEGRWAYYSLATAPRGSSAWEVLGVMRRALAKDPAVAADRRRLAVIRRVDPKTLCVKR